MGIWLEQWRCQMANRAIWAVGFSKQRVCKSKRGDHDAVSGISYVMADDSVVSGI